METLDDFFMPDNEIRLSEELDYSRVDEYIRSAEAFSRSSYHSVYIIDYFRQNFLYVSPNPMFLCGLSPERVKELGYRFYLDFVPEDEQPLLLTLNKAGFCFYNAISNRFKYIRSIYNWAIKTGRLQLNPMQGFTVAQEIYGTPFYLTIDERKKLEEFDFSHDPRLGLHRDLFVFHCCVGCRVSDLFSFTRDNIVGNQLHYIARKTKEGRPITIQVPLNSTAQRILDKYKDCGSDKIFPESAYMSYNKDIKRMLKEAGIDRHVVVIDQLTRESVSRPIYEVASTHMARRTFIGNVYKKFKDQNMVSALTGHKPGSAAFVRYREIDDEMKQEMVDAID